MPIVIAKMQGVERDGGRNYFAFATVWADLGYRSGTVVGMGNYWLRLL